MIFNQGMVDAVRGSLFRERNMDILSNNISNAATAGFKQDRLIFDELLTREVQTDYTQGAVKETGNPLDVAIFGQGFFKVQTPDGIRLTRDGSFKINAQGQLVNSQGYPVMGQGNAPINVNPEGGEVFIDSAGAVNQDGGGLGVLDVVEVADTATLIKEGSNLYTGAEGNAPQGVAAQDYVLEQGALEMSNVDMVPQMVNMIDNFRAFESYQKVVHAINDMDMKSAGQVGRVG